MRVLPVHAAPYAALVMDARSGEVLHSRNADTRLHPASLTKMMTLYIAFEAIEHGEISPDTVVTISRNAASEPPSKLGLHAGQKIKLRYLIRAAAVKSANDAATAIGEAVSGSEAAFARRMNRTAKALGMTRTTFKNANGLTEAGHLSTARDMTILGRHVFYDYPDYYNLFSRITADAGGRQVYNTNRKFLSSYRGADGIKTGYTNAAGFNLVASAERGDERIITTVFGGRSTATRNAEVAKLMDLGFQKAPSRVAVHKPAVPVYVGEAGGVSDSDTTKIVRVNTAVKRSPRPRARPVAEPPAALIAAVETGIETALAAASTVPRPETASGIDAAVIAAVAEAQVATDEVGEDAEAEVILAVMEEDDAAPDAPEILVIVATADTLRPRARPDRPEAAVVLASAEDPGPAISRQSTSQRPAEAASLVVASRNAPEPLLTAPAPRPTVVSRISTSGDRHYGISLGRYSSRYLAERVLLQTALTEMGTLSDALRKVVPRGGGYDANFVGMSEEAADLACRRLIARSVDCQPIGPS